MAGRLRGIASDEPILGLSEPTTRRLRLFSFTWSLAAIAGLYLAGRFELLDTRPGRASFPITIQPIFMILFAVGLIVAIWSEIVGGTLAGFTAAGLGVFASEQLEPGHAISVVVALAVPGIAWVLIDLHDFRPPAAIASIAAIAVAVGSGGFIANDVYDDLFGPAHPSSTTEPPDLPVDWVWVGGVLHDRATIVLRTDAAAPVVRVAAVDGTGPSVEASATPDADGVARFDIRGLRSDTQYGYSVRLRREDDDAELGRFRTFPIGPASFTIAVSSCARTGSNGAVFDAIADTESLLYVITGDLHYANIDDGDRADMVDVMDLALSQPAQSALYRSTSIAYVWDDHDFGGDGSDATSASRDAVRDVYRSLVPHHPLPATSGAIQQAFTVGRVRVVLTDVRSERTPTTADDDGEKSMLGPEQRAWLERELVESAATHAAVIWVNPVPWIAEAEIAADHWGGYTTERRAIADTIADNGIDNLLMVSGDAHMLAIDDGTNSDCSTVGAGGTGGTGDSGDTDGFPVVHAAALDRPGRVKGGPFSEGALAGAGQFATIAVHDDGGETIELELIGRDWTGAALISHTVTFSVAD